MFLPEGVLYFIWRSVPHEFTYSIPYYFVCTKVSFIYYDSQKKKYKIQPIRGFNNDWTNHERVEDV